LTRSVPELTGGAPDLIGSVPRLTGSAPDWTGSVPELTGCVSERKIYLNVVLDRVLHGVLIQEGAHHHGIIPCPKAWATE
jgi:hypothetical protein